MIEHAGKSTTITGAIDTESPLGTLVQIAGPKKVSPLTGSDTGKAIGYTASGRNCVTGKIAITLIGFSTVISQKVSGTIAPGETAKVFGLDADMNQIFTKLDPADDPSMGVGLCWEGGTGTGLFLI